LLVAAYSSTIAGPTALASSTTVPLEVYMGALRWLADNTASAIVGMIVVALVGGIAAILLRRYSSWGTPALYGSAVFALLSVGGLGVLGMVSELSRMRQPHLTPENVEQRIRGWLDNFGLSTKPLGKSDAPDSIFALQVTTDANLPIIVARQKELPRYVLLEVSIELSPEHRTMLSRLTGSQVNQLVRDVRAEMAKCTIPCRIVKPLEKVSVQRRLAITDDLTEDRFMERMDEMSFAFVVANDVIVQGLERMSEEHVG
jgi:hypothetical protein